MKLYYLLSAVMIVIIIADSPLLYICINCILTSTYSQVNLDEFIGAISVFIGTAD